MAIRHYLGIAEPGLQNWSISFPAFPGVVSVGNSFAEVIGHGQDALASVIEAMQAEGQTVPSDYANDPGAASYDRADYSNPHVVVLAAEIGAQAQHIDVVIDAALLSQLDSMAERTHRTRSALLAQGARIVLAVEAAGPG